MATTTVERQEIHCHECGRYVQFDLDLALDGNYVLNCPNCRHEHCRVVRAGRITDERWDTRNAPPIFVNAGTVTSTIYSTYNTTMSGNVFLYSSWLNTQAIS